MYNIFVAQPEFTQKTFSPFPTYKEKFQLYTKNISTSKTLFESGLIVGDCATRPANYQLFDFHSILSMPVKEYNIYVILSQHLNENHIGE